MMEMSVVHATGVVPTTVQSLLTQIGTGLQVRYHASMMF